MSDVAESNVAGAKARLTAMLEESANQAKSRVVEASARVKQSSLVEPLVRQARARADAAHAQVDTAKAMRDLAAALDVSYTKIFASRGTWRRLEEDDQRRASDRRRTSRRAARDAAHLGHREFQGDPDGQHARYGQPVEFTRGFVPGRRK